MYIPLFLPLRLVGGGSGTTLGEFVSPLALFSSTSLSLPGEAQTRMSTVARPITSCILNTSGDGNQHIIQAYIAIANNVYYGQYQILYIQHAHL